MFYLFPAKVVFEFSNLFTEMFCVNFFRGLSTFRGGRLLKKICVEFSGF